MRAKQCFRGQADFPVAIDDDEAREISIRASMMGLGLSTYSCVQSPEQFLAGSGVRYAGTPGPETKEVLNPLLYASPDEYLVAQRRLWLGDAPGTPDSDEWRVSLAGQLRTHGFLPRLLDAAKSGAVELAELVERLGATLPSWGTPDPEYVELVVGSFLSLLSAARMQGSNGLGPLVQVRLQFWMRELARVVSSVGPKPEWAFAADLKTEELRRSMAVIHCRECGLTGWAGTVKDADDRLNPDLDPFYRTFFDFRPEVRFVFPGDYPPASRGRFHNSFVRRVCTSCGRKALTIARGAAPPRIA